MSSLDYNAIVNDKKKIVAMMSTVDGRKDLASEMVNPLREYQDYVSVGRRAFMIDMLLEGTEPYYDKDVDTPSYTVSEEGRLRMNIQRSDRTYCPLAEMGTHPLIPMTQIRARKFDIVGRVREKSEKEIFRLEDKRIFAVLDAAVSGSNPINEPDTVARASATIDDFSKVMAKIERHNNLRVKNIFINGYSNSIIRRIGKDYFTPVQNQEILQTGYMGTLFGAEIHTSPEVPENAIYFTAEPEYTGVLAVGIPLTVLPADDPVNRMVGFSIFQQVGILLHNPKAVAKLVLTD